MAPQPKLVKVGLEAFAMLDDYYGRPNRRADKQYIHQGNQVPKKQPAEISSKKAAEKYGGIVVMEYTNGGRANRFGNGGLKY